MYVEMGFSFQASDGEKSDQDLVVDDASEVSKQMFWYSSFNTFWSALKKYFQVVLSKKQNIAFKEARSQEIADDPHSKCLEIYLVLILRLQLSRDIYERVNRRSIYVGAP